MKKKYVTVLLLLPILLHHQSFSQAKNVRYVDSVQLDESKDLQQQLIPLDSIITIALEHSPAVHFQQDLVDAGKFQVHFMQEIWTNNIAPFFNYTASNQKLISADAQSPNGVTTSNLTNGYRAGVQITFPLYELIGRKARVNLYKSQYQSQIDKREQVKQELAQVLIQEYYGLLFYRNVLTIRSEAKQSTINQYQVAEHEFRDGIINITELSRLKTIEANARADYEEAKRQFATLYFQFQNMVGVPIQEIMLRK